MKEGRSGEEFSKLFFQICFPKPPPRSFHEPADLRPAQESDSSPVPVPDSARGLIQEMTPGSRPSKAFLCHWVGYRNPEKLIPRTWLRMELALQKNPRSQGSKKKFQPFPLEGMGIHSLVKSHGAERRGSQGIVAEGRSPKEARMRAVQNPLTALEWRPGQRWPCRGR